MVSETVRVVLAMQKCLKSLDPDRELQKRAILALVHAFRSEITIDDLRRALTDVPPAF